ncbi:sensor histidine kinase [Pantoea sp. FN060301]|uniref:sensor histidine kinase n=1 Tax=Pantoea sp. FN060301 TaxID=3420380 RepID=UPI003D166BB8
MKLSTLATLMMVAVIATVLLSVHLLYFIQIDNFTHAHVRDKALAVARTLAEDPEVQRSLALPASEALIPPIALAVQKRNNLLFVTVTDMKGIRYSHPNSSLINKRFQGDDLLPALSGHENIAYNRGTLVKALRVFTPVFNAQHQQIGVVAIGISLSDVTAQIHKSRWNVFWTILLGGSVGVLGVLILVRRLKRMLLGLEPHEISTLFEQRQAILNSIKEGVIAVDAGARVTLINQAAQQLLHQSAIEAPLSGDRIPEDSLMLSHLREALHDGKARHDEELNVRERIMISNTVPVRSRGRVIGAVCTFRDKTEISQLMQRLDGMVNYVDALREHSHEFMNKLHVILGLLHMKNYAQMETYILKTANNYQTEIGSLLQSIKSPVIAGFLLSKINRASDKGHRLLLSDDCYLPDSGSEQQVTALVLVLGNLIENALEALEQQQEGEIHLLLHYQNGWLSCEVSDDGPGIPPELEIAIFDKGFSSKGNDRGMGLFLVKQQTETLGGNLSVESEPGVYTQFFVQLPWVKGNKA